MYLQNPPVNVSLLTGQDVIDFIHRMSTNDISNLVEGGGITTVFVTDKGRVIDAVDVYMLGGTVYLIHSHETTDAIKLIFDKYVIMEDISFQENPPYSSLLYLSGGKKGKEISADTPGLIEVHSPRIYPPGKLLLRDFQETEEFSLLKTEQPISIEEYNTLRLEQGIPLYGREFDSNVNPLESGLQQFVNWTKGCYIGQEVIARLDTYHKVKRFLRGIVLDNPVQEDDLRRIESDKTSAVITVGDGQAIGEITSAGFSPELRTTIMMVRLGRGSEKPGTQVELRMNAVRHSGKVVDLPFI
jgi:tRNA-modifying protein YgfZ